MRPQLDERGDSGIGGWHALTDGVIEIIAGGGGDIRGGSQLRGHVFIMIVMIRYCIHISDWTHYI